MLSIGDTLEYEVDGYNYCLVVLDTHTDWVYLRHSPPHEDVRFRYYLHRRTDQPLGIMHDLLNKIDKGHYIYNGSYKKSPPDWEV